VAKLAHAPTLGVGSVQDCGFESRRGDEFDLCSFHNCVALDTVTQVRAPGGNVQDSVSGRYDNRRAVLPMTTRIRIESVILRVL
jgi:hypothetical protein